jgi:hypothetical protein
MIPYIFITKRILYYDVTMVTQLFKIHPVYVLPSRTWKIIFFRILQSDWNQILDPLLHFYVDVSVLAKRYQSKIYSKCLKMEDTARLRVQYLLAMTYNIVLYQQLKPTYIKSSEVASNTEAMKGISNDVTVLSWTNFSQISDLDSKINTENIFYLKTMIRNKVWYLVLRNVFINYQIVIQISNAFYIQMTCHLLLILTLQFIFKL